MSRTRMLGEVDKIISNSLTSIQREVNVKILLVTIIALVFVGFSIQDSFAANPELFTKITIPENYLETNSYVVKSEFVSADLNVLKTEIINITIFDKTYTITQDNLIVRGDNDYSWLGMGADSSAVLTVLDDELVGKIRTFDGTFTIRPLTVQGDYIVSLLDFGTMPPSSEPPSKDTFDLVSALPQSVQDQIDRLERAYNDNHDYTKDDIDVTVNVFVAYTQNAEDELGRVSSVLQNAIDDANQASGWNDLPVEFNLVGTEDVRYSESSNIGDDLDAIADENENTLDRARALAVSNDADIFILVTQPPSPVSCGQAKEILSSSLDNSYAVVTAECIDGLTLVHEMGHLFGAGHNKDFFRLGSPTYTNSVFNYGHGTYYFNGNARTLMSYDCDNNSRIDQCTRWEMWSDPSLNFFGTSQPTGTAIENNAKVVFVTAPYIASLGGNPQSYGEVNVVGTINLSDLSIVQGETVTIRATFTKAIDDQNPPRLEISDGTRTSTVTMSKTTTTEYTIDYTFNSESGTVTLRFTDGLGDLGALIQAQPNGQASFTVTVPDVDPPVITLNPPNPQTIELGNDYTELGARTDDGSTITIVASSVDTATIGTYQVTYDSVDASNNVADTVTRTVNVVDTTPPTFDVDSNPSNYDTIVELGATYNLGSISNIVDEQETTSSITDSSNIANTTPALGTYTVTYTVTENGGTGLSTDIVETVTVRDSVAPSFQVGTNANNFNTDLELGDTYNLLSINTIVDEQSTTSSINDVSSIDGTIPSLGSYTVTYTVTEDAGDQHSTSIVETITVQPPPDITPPVIILDGDALMNIEVHSEFAEPGFTATDETDGIITNNVIVSGQVDTSILETYTLSYDVEDTAENNAITQTRTIVVEDTTDPVFDTIENIVEEATDTLTPLTLITPTVTDNYDGTFVPTVGNSGPFSLGDTTITWTATDSSNNNATATQTITIEDTTIPTFTIPPTNLQIEVNSVPVSKDDIDFGVIEASDIFGVTLENDAPDSFPLGDTLVEWTATDDNDLSATAFQTVTITLSDTNPPTFDVSGNTNDFTTNIELGNTYTQGIIENIVDESTTTQSITGTVDVTTEGEYFVTYTVTDTASTPNSASIIETVTVQDNTPEPIIITTDGTVASYTKITSQTIGTSDGTTIGFGQGDLFGYKTTDIGDVDENGVDDIVSVSYHANNFAGNIHLILMNSDGTLKESHELSNCNTSSPWSFGEAIDYLGEIDGNPTLLVSNYTEDKIHVITINPTDYSHTCSILPTSGLSYSWPLVNAGFIDLDGDNDNIPDIIIGISDEREMGIIFHILDLEYDNDNSQIITASTQIIDTSAIPTEMDWDNRWFENIVIAEIDGDDSTLDLVIGEPREWRNAVDFEGEVIVAFVDRDTFAVTNTSVITPTTLDNPSYASHFGIGLTSMGDLDGDGTDDIVIGMEGNNEGGFWAGSVYVVFMNSDGTVKSYQKISNLHGNLSPDNSGGVLIGDDLFGKGLGAVIDIDGDGLAELIVSAHEDDTGGNDAGAIYVISFSSVTDTIQVPVTERIIDASYEEFFPVDDNDRIFFKVIHANVVPLANEDVTMTVSLINSSSSTFTLTPDADGNVRLMTHTHDGVGREKSGPPASTATVTVQYAGDEYTFEINEFTSTYGFVPSDQSFALYDQYKAPLANP